MSVLDDLERFLAKYDSPDGAAWADGKDFQAQLENAAPDLLRLARAALANVITGADILASMEVMHAALEKLACLGNGSVPGNSVGNEIAKATLVEAKTAGDLCAVRAHVAARHKETA